VKLRSYIDLMGLRTIYWLRKRKLSHEGLDIPATTMPAVRRALSELAKLDLALWTDNDGPSMRVDPGGQIFILTTPVSRTFVVDPDLFDLSRPFDTKLARGPDLHAPRPHLRIGPGKLSGSPNIAHSRIETLTVAALAGRGYDTQKIERLPGGSSSRSVR
jgi:hypothetical protein